MDPTEWEMPPHTVNAYYHPTRNEIVFPAGILQPPMFDADADDAVNFGGIGTVIAHEITHGFDDQGRRFDADGAFRDWWTPADQAHFASLADRLAEQFDEYTVLDERPRQRPAHARREHRRSRRGVPRATGARAR